MLLHASNASTNAPFFSFFFSQNLDQIYARRIILYGFYIADLAHKWQAEFYKVIPKKLASGEYKYTEDITRGLNNTSEAIREVQIGKNTGKKVIIVADHWRLSSM